MDDLGFIHIFLTCALILTTTFDQAISESVISWNKHVTSSSTFSDWVPRRIIDGNQRRDSDGCRCCSATDYQLNPWYQIDLGRQHVVYRIKIDGRDHPRHGQHFQEMEIYFKRVHDGFTDPVFTETNAVYNVEYTLAAPRATRYVSMVLKDVTRVFTICEISIYGECVDGEFGYYCDKRCYCDGEPCDTTSGVCPSGKCLAGYRGDKCDQTCQSGTYGKGCKETCGKCYQNAACNRTNGVCPGRCQSGYRGYLCKLECKPGTYGQDCKHTCGNCADGKPCHVTTGVCEKGCRDGYRSQYCNLECQAGTFGTNCAERCGNCGHGDTCFFTNGTCPNGCKSGFEGVLCKKVCEKGFYGEDCRYTCGKCLNQKPCKPTTGYCSAGCEPGYINDYCNQTCDDGHYGNGCLQDCGNCLDDSICNKVDGICSLGCEPGYKLPMCSDECEDGKYGVNCNEDCGHCFNNTACNKRNGTCAYCQPGYGGHDCFVVLLQQTGGDDTNRQMTPVIGGVIGGVLVLVLIGVLVVIITKRRPAITVKAREQRSIDNLTNHEDTKELNKTADVLPATNHVSKDIKNNSTSPLSKESMGKATSKTTTSPLLAVSVEKETSDKPMTRAESPVHEENEYYGFISRKKELKVCQLWDYIHQKKKEGCSLFYEEFSLLKAGLIHAYDTAMLKENKPKNRYRGLCAYDHSRVALEAEGDESEYINACYIHGVDKVKKFIASQGPTEAMRDDFWRMIWQQNSHQIVMLTNLIEMGTEKCLMYWPESTENDVTYGNITIELESEHREPDYVIRTLKVRKKDEDKKIITQYHFRAWPDKDVPDSTWSLVNFWLHVMNERDNEHGPIVTHCSAGIGRTGTFIALDNAYNQAKLEGVIRILDIVTSLREQRVNMVQTKEQYTFLHEAVADALLFGTHYIWSSQYQHVYQYLTQEVDGVKCQRLKTQFQLIVDSVEERKNVVLNNNSDEDVEYSNVIINKDGSKPSQTVTDFLPKPTDVAEMQALKAVLLPNYKEENTFIIAKSPTNSTCNSFWSLVAENNVKTIVTVRDLSSNVMSLTDCRSENGDYKPSFSEENKTSFHTEMSCTCVLKDVSTTVRHFEFNNLGDTSPIPKDNQSMLGFLEVILDCQQRLTPDHPVLVYCSTGYERSGLICVLLNELERMKRDEGHINIVETVKLMKESNENIIPNFEQYKCIHDVILSTFDRGEVYANC